MYFIAEYKVQRNKLAFSAYIHLELYPMTLCTLKLKVFLIMIFQYFQNLQSRI